MSVDYKELALMQEADAQRDECTFQPNVSPSSGGRGPPLGRARDYLDDVVE